MVRRHLVTLWLHWLQRQSLAVKDARAPEAVRAAVPQLRMQVLVTGSLYLVSDVLRLLGKPPLCADNGWKAVVQS